MHRFHAQGPACPIHGLCRTGTSGMQPLHGRRRFDKGYVFSTGLPPLQSEHSRAGAWRPQQERELVQPVSIFGHIQNMSPLVRCGKVLSGGSHSIDSARTDRNSAGACCCSGACSPVALNHLASIDLCEAAFLKLLLRCAQHCFLFWPNLLKCDPLVVLSGNTLGVTFPEIPPK